MERTCKNCGSLWDLNYITDEMEITIEAGEITHCPACSNPNNDTNIFYDTLGTHNIPQAFEDFDPSSLID